MKSILFFLLLSVSSVVVFAQKQVIDFASPGARAQGNSMPSRLSMTPTTTRQTQVEKGINEAGVKRTEPQPKQTQGSTFGESMTNGTKAANNNPLFNGSGSKGDNPMFEPSGQARPGQPIGGIIVKGGKNPAGKGIQENGIKRTESAGGEEKRTYTAGR
ncbi:MAG: hypothetical protein QM594_05570 [Niabella sp.]